MLINRLPTTTWYLSDFCLPSRIGAESKLLFPAMSLTRVSFTLDLRLRSRGLASSRRCNLACMLCLIERYSSVPASHSCRLLKTDLNVTDRPADIRPLSPSCPRCHISSCCHRRVNDDTPTSHRSAASITAFFELVVRRKFAKLRVSALFPLLIMRTQASNF